MSRPVFVSSTAFTPRPLKNPVSLQRTHSLMLLAACWRALHGDTYQTAQELSTRKLPIHVVIGPRQAELSLCFILLVKLRPRTETELFTHICLGDSMHVLAAFLYLDIVSAEDRP